MSIQRRIYEQNLGVNEAVKVGDTVHIGHGTKGGTGVTGKVTKVSGGMVHIQNDKGDTFKGPVDRVTVKEAVKPAMRAGIDYKPATPTDAQKKIMKGEADKAAKMRSTPDTSAAGRAAQRMIDARKATQAGLRMKQQNQESVELEEGPAHQNPRITAFGGMQAAQNTPSFQRYQERLKKEREARAKKAAAATQAGLEAKRQKRESVELDELKMPKRDASGRIKSAKVRDALQTGGSRAQKQALKHDASAHAKLMRAADTQDQAVANMDKEGMKKANRQIDAANADMARSRRAFARMKKRHRQAESVEFDESIVGRWRRKSREGFTFKNKNKPKPTDKAPEPKSKELPKDMRNEARLAALDAKDRISIGGPSAKLTPAQERDAERRLKPTRATVAKVRVPAGTKDIAKSVKAYQDAKGGNPGNTKKRRLRDLRLRNEEVQTDEAIKYDSAGDSTGTVTGKGKRDRGPGGQVMVQYKGSETYPKGAKLPIGARDMGRLLRTARKKGTTPYDSRNLRNPRLTKDHVELEGLDLSEMNFLGKDKKFGREFYEKGGQLHVKKPGGTYVQNLGSVDVPANKKMMKGLVKDSNESVELDELKMPKKDKFGRITSKKVRDAYRKGAQRASNISTRATRDMTGSPDPKKRYKGLNRGMNAVTRMMDRDDKARAGGLVSSYEPEGNQLDEVSPPGFEGTVKAMKKRHSDKIDNPWALTWWMKKKGYKSHKNADGSDKKEQ